MHYIASLDVGAGLVLPPFGPPGAAQGRGASSEDLLGRGERLDSLVARSDALAVRSQALRTTAKDVRAGAAQQAAQRRGGGGACGGGAAPALLLALFGCVGMAYFILRVG